jgi:hypothetical protein
MSWGCTTRPDTSTPLTAGRSEMRYEHWGAWILWPLRRASSPTHTTPQPRHPSSPRLAFAGLAVSLMGPWLLPLPCPCHPLPSPPPLAPCPNRSAPLCLCSPFTGITERTPLPPPPIRAPVTTFTHLAQVDYEHGNTPQSYTLQFDAIVAALWASVDPLHSLRFNGMNLPNIDDTDKVVSWATYFLNTSNHASGVAAFTNSSLASIGYHVSCRGGEAGAFSVPEGAGLT